MTSVSQGSNEFTFGSTFKLFYPFIMFLLCMLGSIIGYKTAAESSAKEYSQYEQCEPNWECTTETHNKIDRATGLTCNYGEYWFKNKTGTNSK